MAKTGLLMTEVLTGLIGIVVGGVLTGAVEQSSAWFGRRRDLRTAARLVAADAERNVALIEHALKRGEWWPDHRRPTTKDWAQYRQDLATEMPIDDLDIVQTAFTRLEIIDDERQQGRSFASLQESLEELRPVALRGGALLLSYSRTRRERKLVKKQKE